MTSKHEAERLEVRAMQREKERERRRLRDRQRRQNMSQEQRERHLARRRRNYQLRRMRARNAKLVGSQQSHTSIGSAGVDQKMVKPHSACIPQLELSPGSRSQDLGGTQKLQNSPRRLRLSDIRHLARRLHSAGEGRHQTGGDEIAEDHNTKTCLSTKRLSLILVKRLARSLKVNMKQDCAQ